MKKILGIITGVLVLSVICYFTFVYYATYSEGVRSGHLIKFSHKGVAFKTWEGELSQGLSGSQIFSFSVMDNQKEVIDDLKNMEGQYVKATYIERYKTFPWWGDTRYFIIAVKKEESPFSNN
jgi:uncharacterized protein YxeA